jgi:hypothetical protein
MSVYTRRVLATVVPPGGESDVTVPAGYIWILNDLSGLALPATSGAAGYVVALAAGVAWTGLLNPGFRTNLHWVGRLTCGPGDPIQLINRIDGPWHALLTAYVFPT